MACPVCGHPNREGAKFCGGDSPATDALFAAPEPGSAQDLGVDLAAADVGRRSGEPNVADRSAFVLEVDRQAGAVAGADADGRQDEAAEEAEDGGRGGAGAAGERLGL